MRCEYMEAKGLPWQVTPIIGRGWQVAITRGAAYATARGLAHLAWDAAAEDWNLCAFVVVVGRLHSSGG
jgi:hypothetical protein